MVRFLVRQPPTNTPNIVMTTRCALRSRLQAGRVVQATAPEIGLFATGG
ncbi:MAG TPA: hypothetical protein VIK60_01750 [Vicinamibacterales bacterium]